ncbi:unknown protein [Desulfotalea psychrophila LSv54]|uniref:Zinc finger/thioredoxin putative domain-containing protein n=2 Tax=Desulfotalea psychrophila TaxID=84980 RepID=Q6APU8_DESPS|nr:unknown protein [Desulfotalea psychrophila LSv54]
MGGGMIVQCPNCGKKLKAGAKLIQGIQDLPAGEELRVRCTQCSTSFGVSGSSLAADSSAGRKLQPPAAPDTSWLGQADLVDPEVDSRPSVMLLVRDNDRRELLSQAFSSLGYFVEFCDSPREALEKMQFVVYSAVMLADDYESVPLTESLVHVHMCAMHMDRRRHILYILVGENYHSLYDLEALVYSANMVVNNNDVEYFPVMLKKLVREYDSLFGGLMGELQLVGK